MESMFTNNLFWRSQSFIQLLNEDSSGSLCEDSSNTSRRDALSQGSADMPTGSVNNLFKEVNMEINNSNMMVPRKMKRGTGRRQNHGKNVMDPDKMQVEKRDQVTDPVLTPCHVVSKTQMQFAKQIQVQQQQQQQHAHGIQMPMQQEVGIQIPIQQQVYMQQMSALSQHYRMQQESQNPFNFGVTAGQLTMCNTSMTDQSDKSKMSNQLMRENKTIAMTDVNRTRKVSVATGVNAAAAASNVSNNAIVAEKTSEGTAMCELQLAPPKDDGDAGAAPIKRGEGTVIHHSFSDQKIVNNQNKTRQVTMMLITMIITTTAITTSMVTNTASSCLLSTTMSNFATLTIEDSNHTTNSDHKRKSPEEDDVINVT